MMNNELVKYATGIAAGKAVNYGAEYLSGIMPAVRPAITNAIAGVGLTYLGMAKRKDGVTIAGVTTLVGSAMDWIKNMLSTKVIRIPAAATAGKNAVVTIASRAGAKTYQRVD
jgi:hypothetical protein